MAAKDDDFDDDFDDFDFDIAPKGTKQGEEGDESRESDCGGRASEGYAGGNHRQATDLSVAKPRASYGRRKAPPINADFDDY